MEDDADFNDFDKDISSDADDKLFENKCDGGIKIGCDGGN